MRIVHNSENCIGCKACQQACQDYHNLPARVRFMEITETETMIDGQVAVTYHMSVCRQCRHAACLSECMEGAISKNEQGVAVIDEALCIGCGRCMEACPEYAIRLKKTSRGRKAIKCAVCINYIKKGEAEGAARRPICAEACPLDCISVGA